MHSMAWWPTVAVVLVATITDLRSHRIPNWLVLPFLAIGFSVSGWLHGWHGLLQSTYGAGLGLLLFGVFRGFHDGRYGGRRRETNAAAIGAWIGPSQLMLALVHYGDGRWRDGSDLGGVRWIHERAFHGRQ